MRTVVFSDVHGNLPALESMLKDAGPAEGYICLGDTVDYGPWSNECVDRISSLPNLIYLAGNHEEDFLKGSYTGENAIASAFFAVCRPTFERYDVIKNLSKTYKLNGFIFRHTILGKNIYPDAELTLDHNYVIGHSHHQFWIEQQPYRLYNTGSVGQNRKYINVINYLVLETDTMEFEMHALLYNPDTIIDEMRRRSYPEQCIAYYADKARFVGTPQTPRKPATIL